MVFRYYPETDMLYIELIKQPSVESEEVADGVVLDFDATNRVVGIEIEDASQRMDLSSLEVSALPLASLTMQGSALAVAR